MHPVEHHYPLRMVIIMALSQSPAPVPVQTLCTAVQVESAKFNSF
uniref:Uncharacterized protein n=1 Tax=Anguilla anguilla TaxID=7936 RepID=A0A0E9QPV5_ANGAN